MQKKATVKPMPLTRVIDMLTTGSGQHTVERKHCSEAPPNQSVGAARSLCRADPSDTLVRAPANSPPSHKAQPPEYNLAFCEKRLLLEDNGLTSQEEHPVPPGVIFLSINH